MSDNFEKLKHLLFPRKVRVESLLALKQGISLTDHPTRYYKISFYFSHSLHIQTKQLMQQQVQKATVRYVFISALSCLALLFLHTHFNKTRSLPGTTGHCTEGVISRVSEVPFHSTIQTLYQSRSATKQWEKPYSSFLPELQDCQSPRTIC